MRDLRVRWSFAALTTIEVPVLTLWFVNLSGGKDSKPSAALHDWAEMRLKQLDGWLTNRRFIATEDFTVADIHMTHVLDAGTQHEMLKPYPSILATDRRDHVAHIAGAGIRHGRRGACSSQPWLAGSTAATDGDRRDAGHPPRVRRGTV